MTELHSTSTAAQWRLHRWPTVRSIAHLVFTDMLEVPTVEDFDTARRRAAERGAVAVRTSALFPRAQRAAVLAGFEPIDQLRLLKLNLDHGTDRTLAPVAPDDRCQLTAMRSWHLTAAAEVDRECFGQEWGNSTRSLQHILNATSQARARIVRSRDAPRSNVGGFVVSGISESTGYIQRLAVGIGYRRRGYARALVADGVSWMLRRGVTSCFVNTGIDNDAALNLYASLGFEDTGELLTISERRVLETNPGGREHSRPST